MNKYFEKFCNSLNYRTYNNIKDTLFFTSIGSIVANVFFIGSDTYVKILLSLILFISDILGCGLSVSDGKYCTKDVIEIRKLYQEFITNYNKLNNTFGFNEPISVYTMYNYLLYKGYLSKDKSFINSNEKCIDLPTLYGVDIFNGRGVCRHISSLLSDILNDLGIESVSFGCYMRPYSLDVKLVEKGEYSKEKIIKNIYRYVQDEKERKILLMYIDMCENLGVFFDMKIDFVLEKKKKQVSNHAITFSLYEDKNYFLDPTQERIYRLRDSDEGILCDSIDDKIIIKDTEIKRLNDLNNRKIYDTYNKILVPRESISLEEEEKIITLTSNICTSNMDVFEQFYNENRDLYGEISSRLVKVRKR